MMLDCKTQPAVLHSGKSFYTLPVWLALALLLYIRPGIAQPNNSRVDQQRDWQGVLEAHGSAFSKLEEEMRSAPSAKLKAELDRQRAFAEAERRLGDYMRRWIPDPESVSYLSAGFRVGLYREYGGAASEACVIYQACLGHPKISHPDAKFDHEMVSAHCVRRLTALGPVCKGPEGSMDRTSIKIAIKGSIEGVHHVLSGESHRPLMPMEMLAIATRRTEWQQPERALNIGKELLLKQDLSFGAASADGLAVFAVSGTESQARFLAQDLVRFRQRMNEMYFDSQVVRPLLYVYANVNANNGEGIGRVLSRALHFRELHEIEGYYQPLDHSLVLRKNLYTVSGDWFTGTPHHEISHALMHVDFPQAPLWLDEGLAALHEEESEEGPLDNYRLFYVKEALAQGKLPPLRVFLDSNEPWPEREQPLRAAMSRYFCMYLFERKPGRTSLGGIYRRLRTELAGSDKKFSSEVLQNLTQTNFNEIENDFIQFIRDRSAERANQKWGALRAGVYDYVKSLGVIQ
jgi:hypothetical protein